MTVVMFIMLAIVCAFNIRECFILRKNQRLLALHVYFIENKLNITNRIYIVD